MARVISTKEAAVKSGISTGTIAKPQWRFIQSRDPFASVCPCRHTPFDREDVFMLLVDIQFCVACIHLFFMRVR